MSTNTNYYPISVDEILDKISKKNGRKNTPEKLDNIKKITNDYGEKIVRVDGEIPPDLPVKNNDRFLFISYDQSILTHGLHKYPAKFFPELPRWIIKKYSNEGDIVLDPFSGSGTANVEALLSKRHSVGIDVDPFSRFLSKVKTTPIAKDELDFSKKLLLRSIVNYKPSKVSNRDIPLFPYRDNWFNKEIILELSYLKKKILSLDISQNTKNFYKICFSSILRAVSNADDNCTRTVIRKKLNKMVYPADALKRFTEKILINIPKVIEFSESVPQRIKVDFPDKQDARNISNYHDGYFDLALTSPPYCNAVDYPRTHQLELYWLELANGSLTQLKREHVGTESVLLKEYKKLHKTYVKQADTTIARIYKKDPRRAFIAYKYLSDMRQNLIEVHRKLKKGGRYVVVIGNNKIRNELFESRKYLMDIADLIGFEIECCFASEIIKHFIKVPREERINTDWVLVLKK